jgi:hypothetical protein
MIVEPRHLTGAIELSPLVCTRRMFVVQCHSGQAAAGKSDLNPSLAVAPAKSSGPICHRIK